MAEIATDPIKDALSQFKYDDKTKSTLRAQGVNVTKLDAELTAGISEAIKTGDIQKARKSVFEWANNTDRVSNTNFSSNIGALFNQQATYKDAILQTTPSKTVNPEVESSFSDIKNFGKQVGNGIIDLGAGLGALAITGITYGSQPFLGKERANAVGTKAAKEMFSDIESIKFDVEKAYQQSFITPSKDPNNAIGFDFNGWKSFVGTGGQLVGFMAPMILGGGVARVLTAVPKGAAMAAPELALNAATKANQIALKINFASEFATTYGNVVKESLDSGMKLQDASYVGMPVALATAAISQIGARNFVNKFGASVRTANRVSNQIAGEVLAEQMAKLAGKSLDASDFLRVAQAVTREAEKRMSSKIVFDNTRKFLGNVLTTSAIEFGEEFSQSGLDLIAKQTYNYIADKNGSTDGRFKDMSFKDGFKAALSEGFTGAIFGSLYGGKGNNTKVDNTVYSSIINSITKSKAQQGQNFDPAKINFDVDAQIEKMKSSGSITDSEYAGLQTKIGLMKQVALDFHDSDASIQEQSFMFNAAKARFNIGKKEATMKQALDFVNAIEQDSTISQERKMFEWSKASQILGAEIQQADGAIGYENMLKLEEEKTAIENFFREATSKKVTVDNAVENQKSRIAELDNLNKKYKNETLDFNPEIVVKVDGVDYLVDTQTHTTPIIKTFSSNKLSDSGIENVFGQTTYTPATYESNTGDNVTDVKLISRIINEADTSGGTAYNENTDLILSAKQDLVEAKAKVTEAIANIDPNLPADKQSFEMDKIKDQFEDSYLAISKYIGQVDPEYKLTSLEELSSDIELPKKSAAIEEQYSKINDVYRARAIQTREKLNQGLADLSKIQNAQQSDIDLVNSAFESDLESINADYKKELSRFNKKNKTKYDTVPLLESAIQETPVTQITENITENPLPFTENSIDPETIQAGAEASINNITENPQSEFQPLNEIQQNADDITTGKKLLKRFSQEEQRGIADGGRIHAEATVLLATSEGASGEVEVQEALIEEFAKENGFWTENAPETLTEQYGQPISQLIEDQNSEATVWLIPDGTTVVKSQNISLYEGNIQEKLDSITLHNAYFPEAKTEIIGFGRAPDGQFQVIVIQKFIKASKAINDRGDAKASTRKQKKVVDHMTKLGFQPIDAYTYANGETLIEDLHAGNVIITPKGGVAVIDPIMRLNTPEQGYGGTRVVSNEIVDINQQVAQPLIIDNDNLKDIDSTFKALNSLKSTDSLEDLFLRSNGNYKRWFSDIGKKIFLENNGFSKMPTYEELRKRNIDPKKFNNDFNAFLENNENLILSIGYHTEKGKGYNNSELVLEIESALSRSPVNENTNGNTVESNTNDEFNPEADLNVQQLVQRMEDGARELDSEATRVESEEPSEQSFERIQEQINGHIEQLGEAIRQTGDIAFEQPVDENTDTTGAQQNEPTPGINDTVNGMAEYLFGQIKRNFPNIGFNLLSDSEFSSKANELYPAQIGAVEYAFIDPKTGKVYFNRDTLNPNILMHEMGHLWSFYAKQNMPEVYRRGLELTKSTSYERKAKEKNPELSGEALANEALAIAIGDKGASFVNQTKKNNFLAWAKGLYDSVKKYLGFTPGIDLENMTLASFTDNAVAEIFNKRINSTEGQIADQIEKSGFITSTPVGFAGNPEYSSSDLESMRDNIFNAAIGVTIDATTGKIQKADKETLNALIIDSTGWRLDSINSDLTGNFSFLPNIPAEHRTLNFSWYNKETPAGSVYVKTRKDQVVNYLSNGDGNFLSTITGPMARIYKGIKAGPLELFSYMERFTFNTMMDLMESKDGTMIKEFFIDVDRKGKMRKYMYARITHPLAAELAETMADYDTGYIYSYENAPKESVEVFTEDGSGKEQLAIPIDVLLSMYRAHRSMLESYGKSAVISATGARRRNNADNAAEPKGMIFYEKSTGESKAIPVLMEQSEMDRIEAMIQANPKLMKANDLLAEIYGNATVLQLVKEVNDHISPDAKFNPIAEYSPLRVYSTRLTKEQMLAGDGLIENARILQERENLSDGAYIIFPPVFEANSHISMTQDILGSAILAQNLAKLNDDAAGIFAKYPKIKDYMTRLFESTNGVYKENKKDAKDHAFDFLTSRFVKSVFRFNFGLPFKQFGTLYSITDIRDSQGQRLISKGAAVTGYKVLTNMGLIQNFTTNLGVRADNQYAGTIKSYLDEMISYDTLWPTVNRVMEADINGVYGLTSINFSQAGGVLSKIQNGARAADNWLDAYGMSFTKKADTAVILATFESAKVQAVKNGFLPGTDLFKQEVGRITNEVVYKTNQVNDVTEKTFYQQNTSMVSRAFNMFSSQQQKIYNIVMENYIRSQKDPGNAQKKTAFYKSIGMSVVLNAVNVAVVTAMYSTLRKLASGDEPDDDEKILKKIGRDIFTNILGTFPGTVTVSLDTILRQIESEFTMDDTLGVPQGVVSMQKLLGTVADAVKIASTKEEIDDSFLYELINSFDRITGLPDAWSQVLRKKFLKLSGKEVSGKDIEEVYDTEDDLEAIEEEELELVE